MYKILNKYVTDVSKQKIQGFDKRRKAMETIWPSRTLAMFGPDLHPTLQKNLSLMTQAFGSKLDLRLNKKISLSQIKSQFNEFIDTILDGTSSKTNSKLRSDINIMTYLMPMIMFVDKSKIKINFLLNKSITNSKCISLIVHAINTFVHMFPYNYNGLEINICLDENLRQIPDEISDWKVPDKINYLRANSLAFNVSGVTYSAKKLINVTKKEEMIKLLFHELIHFIGLDDTLLGVKFNNTWNVETDNSNLNLSEAYTEFIAIILTTMYESIHLGYLTDIESKVLFSEILSMEISHSIYLTSRILFFFGFNNKNYKDFFTGVSAKKIDQPILLIEYIFLRSILFLNLDVVLDVIGENFRLEKSSVNPLVQILREDHNLIKALRTYMTDPKLIAKSVSYMAVDIDCELV